MWMVKSSNQLIQSSILTPAIPPSKDPSAISKSFPQPTKSASFHHQAAPYLQNLQNLLKAPRNQKLTRKKRESLGSLESVVPDGNGGGGVPQIPEPEAKKP